MARRLRLAAAGIGLLNAVGLSGRVAAPLMIDPARELPAIELLESIVWVVIWAVAPSAVLWGALWIHRQVPDVSTGFRRIAIVLGMLGSALMAVYILAEASSGSPSRQGTRQGLVAERDFLGRLQVEGEKEEDLRLALRSLLENSTRPPNAPIPADVLLVPGLYAARLAAQKRGQEFVVTSPVFGKGNCATAIQNWRKLRGWTLLEARRLDEARRIKKELVRKNLRKEKPEAIVLEEIALLGAQRNLLDRRADPSYDPPDEIAPILSGCIDQLVEEINAPIRAERIRAARHLF